MPESNQSQRSLEDVKRDTQEVTGKDLSVVVILVWNYGRDALSEKPTKREGQLLNLSELAGSHPILRLLSLYW